MTSEQFELLVKLTRGNRDSAATKGAYLVLVEGMKQGEAVKATNSSPANVHDACVRYVQAHEQILYAYGINVNESPCIYFPSGVISNEQERTPMPVHRNYRGNIMNISLKVDWHPSGNRTLKERKEGARMWRDCDSSHDLIANSDSKKFYSAVQRYIDTLIANKVSVDFTDSATKPASSIGIKIKTNAPTLTLNNLDFDKLSQSPNPQVIIDTIAKLLQIHYPNIYIQPISWLAYREEIQKAHARKLYGDRTQPEIAISWGNLAKKGLLHVSFDESLGLNIHS
ncbi:hypothetical protein [Pectobacterium versatile]|uniref:hypothetical protein n=1 Tax=Pectobacterium versatile TaxID=2488639 RepID=UPI00196980D9|nr:hypothetical protein [Pectobacterium versatile]MBN3237208.1 hypothetical protein [Pectobacterium versatile]